ncbi:MAG: Sir2 family NAD-dependent protein deacetylase [bacterium]
MELRRLESLLTAFRERAGRIAVLTGAGISAESGIPTFRGPEGYWTVGSTEYRPEQMATVSMFGKDPWEVWSWYLYRRAVCARAAPNPGHLALARIESALGGRFRLITQNVDGLHLRAGNTPERTFQIHGNLHLMRCSRACCDEVEPVPPGVCPKQKNEPVTEREKGMLRCSRCGGLARPHVLWFDEYYEERLFQAESAFRWAQAADLLLVIGTSGATTLPMRIGELFMAKQDALFLDVNPHPNPFRAMAESHPGGLASAGTACQLLPIIADIIER